LRAQNLRDSRRRRGIYSRLRGPSHRFRFRTRSPTAEDVLISQSASAEVWPWLVTSTRGDAVGGGEARDPAPVDLEMGGERRQDQPWVRYRWNRPGGTTTATDALVISIAAGLPAR